jgi:tRNA modification GTPase
MSDQISGWDDTIACTGNAFGIGAIGVIRLSGKKAIEIVNELFPSRRPTGKQDSHTIHVGFIKEDQWILMKWLSHFLKPTQLYREDVVEISCHGSPYVQQQVIKACLRKGARLQKAESLHNVLS